MSSKLKFITGALAATAVVAVFFAPQANAQQAQKAAVRFVHASPDAPAVDIYVNDREVFSNSAFKRVTSYSQLDAGTYTVKVFPTSANGQGNPVTQAQVTLNGGWDYTLAAVGKLANVQAKLISDNLNTPGQGKTKVRAYHFSPNAPAVNVGVKDGSTLVRGLSFPNATDYITADSGRLNLVVQDAGNNTTVTEIPNANLASNTVQSVFVFGLTGNETPALSTLVTTDRRGAVQGANTPATGAEDSLAFMVLAAGLMLTAGVAMKKMAKIEESNR